MKAEQLWAIELRLVELHALVRSGDGSYLDEFEISELTAQHRYWKQRNRMKLINGGKA